MAKMLFIAFAAAAVAVLIFTVTHAAALPPLPGTNQSGFGGFISSYRTCTCKTVGIMITVNGLFGGDFLISLANPPAIQLGKYKLVGGPVLGSAAGSARCGWGGSCGSSKTVPIVRTIAGIESAAGY